MEIIETGSTIEWQAERGGLRFASEPAGAKTLTAFIGREKNGVFF